MKVIVAFDSFKGCLSAIDACAAAREGLLRRYPDADIVCFPMSDGGEGMVECVAHAVSVEWVEAEVHDPLMRPIIARYAVSNDHRTAYIEMAAAAGLTLVSPAERNPMRTTTFGVGELLLDAVRRGCHNVVMGIGGSATCDGGAGMIECLRPHLPLPIHIDVASDVTNPLFGPEGAAYVFAPQKGATPQQVIELDQRLRDFALQTVSQGFASDSLAFHPGAGAAGGLGYGLMAYLGATMQSGIDLLLDIVGFNARLEKADMVLTGEGCSDYQTLMGKVPFGILQRCRQYGVPVHLLSGGIKNRDILQPAGFASVQSINANDKRPLDVLMQPQVASHNLYISAMLSVGSVQRLTIDGGFTCPNRDGTVGSGGCSFCNPKAFAPSYCREVKGIAAQIQAGKQFFARKHRDSVAYLAYFQSFSGTYAPVTILRQRYYAALREEGVLGLVIGTRPDCITPEVLDLLSDISQKHFVMIEFGVESCYDKTLLQIGRGHDYQCAVDAICATAERGIAVGVHLIIGLPGESRDQIVHEAEMLSELPVSHLKLHQLQILRGTRMGEAWLQDPSRFHPLTVHEYADLVADFVSHLRPDITLGRFAAQSPSDLLLAPCWGMKPNQVQQLIEKRLSGIN